MPCVPSEAHAECLFVVLEPAVVGIVLLRVAVPSWESVIGPSRTLRQHLMAKIPKNPSLPQKCVQRRPSMRANSLQFDLSQKK